MRKRRIYLAGPMTGIPEDNHPAFDEASRGLEAMGWAVHSPASSYNRSQTLPYELYMHAAVTLLLQADAIALMDGWQGSRGALMEILLAQRLQLPFYNAHTGRRMQLADIELSPPEVVTDGGRPFPKNEQLLRALAPIARELAAGNRDGITVTDIRIEAEARGILTGEEHPHQLSALGHVCRRAGLVNTGQVRRSVLEVTHGINQTVWVENLSSA